MRKLLTFLVVVLLLIGGFFAIKNLIRPQGSIILTGSFDPTAIRIYINGTQVIPRDLSVREFTHTGSGTVPILISGPSIKTISSTLSIKPLFGGTKKLAVQASNTSIEDIAARTLKLNPGQTIDNVKSFVNDWIGASVVTQGQSSANYALHFDYKKGQWILAVPGTKEMAADPVFKGAPAELLNFLNETDD